MEITMNSLTKTYRTFRRNLSVPAESALRSARAEARFRAHIAEIGFAWQQDRHYNRFASWKEEGFDLRARIVIEDDGWWSAGEQTTGKFIDRWQPAAIRHHKAGRNEYLWFLPVNPEYGREDYRRACAYGRDWWYVGVEVTASRAGVEFGEISLWGIEYEPGGDDDYLTEIALNKSSEAIREATRKLKELCGCH
jgi:hypothetical protein